MKRNNRIIKSALLTPIALARSLTVIPSLKITKLSLLTTVLEINRFLEVFEVEYKNLI